MLEFRFCNQAWEFCGIEIKGFGELGGLFGDANLQSGLTFRKFAPYFWLQVFQNFSKLMSKLENLGAEKNLDFKDFRQNKLPNQTLKYKKL